MKDALGHGSDPKTANVIPFPNPAAHQQAVVEALHQAILPSMANVTRAPAWLERMGRAIKRGHSPV